MIPSRFRSLMRRLFYFVLRVVGHGCRSSESQCAGKIGTASCVDADLVPRNPLQPAIRRANGLPLTRPRAFGFLQRDALRRAVARRGSAGPTNGTRSGAAAELGGSSRWNRSSYATFATRQYRGETLLMTAAPSIHALELLSALTFCGAR